MAWVGEKDFQGSLGFGHIHPVLEVMKRLYNQKTVGVGVPAVGVI